MSAPLDIVRQHYVLPFNPRPFQAEDVNEAACLDRSALYWHPGLGKTFGATLCALYKKWAEGVALVLVIVPPILIPNWRRFIGTIKHADGEPLRALAYRGSPKERSAMSFNGFDFVILSTQIFKRDIDRIESECAAIESRHKKHVHVIVDEAQCLKNVASQTYKTISRFAIERSIQLLTGTPLSSPIDAYAYVKTLAPTVYKTLYQFESIHIEQRDFFGNVTKWGNLDLLEANMKINTFRRIKEDVLLDLPSHNVVPLVYDLDPQHAALYKKLATEQMLKLENGEKLDATSVSALFHALGQIVCNLGHFAQNPELEANIFQLIDEVLDEIGQEKLVVFTNYRMTSKAVVERYAMSHGATAVYGDVTPKHKEAALQRFITDATCRVLVLQQSAIAGIDELQTVCNNSIFIEVPSVPSLFEQAAARLWRDGQQSVTTTRVAIANGTLQARTAAALAKKQTLVNSIQGSRAELQAALFGE